MRILKRLQTISPLELFSELSVKNCCKIIGCRLKFKILRFSSAIGFWGVSDVAPYSSERTLNSIIIMQLESAVVKCTASDQARLQAPERGQKDSLSLGRFCDRSLGHFSQYYQAIRSQAKVMWFTQELFQALFWAYKDGYMKFPAALKKPLNYLML